MVVNFNRFVGERAYRDRIAAELALDNRDVLDEASDYGGSSSFSPGSGPSTTRELLTRFRQHRLPDDMIDAAARPTRDPRDVLHGLRLRPGRLVVDGGCLMATNDDELRVRRGGRLLPVRRSSLGVPAQTGLRGGRAAVAELRRAGCADLAALPTVVGRRREPDVGREEVRLLLHRNALSPGDLSPARWILDFAKRRFTDRSYFLLSEDSPEHELLGSFDRTGKDVDTFVPKNVPWVERDYFNDRVLPDPASKRVRAVSRRRCPVEHAVLRGDHVPVDTDRVEPATHRQEQGRAVDRLQGVLPGRRPRLRHEASPSTTTDSSSSTRHS